MDAEQNKSRERRIRSALAQARLRLQGSPYSEVRQLSCEADGRTLRLDGCVSRFHLKQVAQHLVSDLRGFDALENRITVTARYRDAS